MVKVTPETERKLRVPGILATVGIPGLRCRPGRLIVYQDIVKQSEVVSASGIIEKLNTGPEVKASSGVLIAVPESYEDFVVGDRVLFSPYSGFSMHYKGDKRYMVLSDHEVFASYAGGVGDVEVR